jgi:cytochrome d ubiquinol oxidase subunit I
VLPTFLASSSLSRAALWTTIAGFTLIYGALAVIEVRLILATIKHGPDEDEAQAPAPVGAPIPAQPLAA